MTRVLHVFKTSMPYSYGGVESFIDTLCKTDSALGVQNTLLTLHPHPETHPIQMTGYTVHQAKQILYLASTGFSITAFKKFMGLSRAADIIHYHFPNPFADMLHMVCSPGKPTVCTYHSDIIKQKYLLHLYKPLQRRFLGSVNKIVATSPNYVASSPILQTYRDKVSVIPIGLDHTVYETAPLDRLRFWKNRLPGPFFLFVGALRYYKGLHTLLKAIAGTKIQVVIAGGGGVEADLKAQAAALNLETVTFLGSVSEADKSALLHLCTGYVFPSHLRSEAFGISLLEASAVGKPMVTCEIGTGTTFVNVAHETGLVVPPDSPDHLEQALRDLLGDPDRATSMGQAAKRRCRALFGADHQARAYFDLYQTLTGNELCIKT